MAAEQKARVSTRSEEEQCWLFRFGAEVKRCRENRHLSQRILADQVGTSRHVVMRVELGRTNVTATIAVRIAQAVGATFPKWPASEEASAVTGSAHHTGV